MYAGAARCRADALGGEVPSGAFAACCVLRGAGAAITLLYGVSVAFTMSKKARLALLKFSQEASADQDPSVPGPSRTPLWPCVRKYELVVREA